ncbi:hypothetical protein CYY_008951 [Polysphondylium violaceum]|uniref:Rab-GAP TBC domain-containing protein n=1 Tax=Polysphondylium violaceum TaxID=133409 RepID=A0A8J4PMA1_9MYCE|nr:hypothetical protein CYY_008951 [Polysphondylium violaceum]
MSSTISPHSPYNSPFHTTKYNSHISNSGSDLIATTTAKGEEIQETETEENSNSNSNSNNSSIDTPTNLNINENNSIDSNSTQVNNINNSHHMITTTTTTTTLSTLSLNDSEMNNQNTIIATSSINSDLLESSSICSSSDEHTTIPLSPCAISLGSLHLVDDSNSSVNNDDSFYGDDIQERLEAAMTPSTTTTATTTTTTTTTTMTLDEDDNFSIIENSGEMTTNGNIVSFSTKASPSFGSKAPDVRDSVNGFPRLSNIKKREYIWLEQVINYHKTKEITADMCKLAKVGIPTRVRGYVWRVFSNSIELERKNIGVYQHFLTGSNEEYEYKISKDIARTFPNNPIFCTEAGQNSLFNILKAYSIMDPEIGYTQGMSFICAVILSEMDELETFWVFTSVMKNFKLSSLYSNDLSLLRQYLYTIDRLIETTMPKLFSHFKEIGVTPVLFASEWISTLFTYNFALPVSKRLLDVFFVEGRFYLYKVALSVLKIYEKQLITFEFEDAVEFLKKLGYQIDPSLLIKIADSLPSSLDSLIEQFEEEFTHPHAPPSDYF